MKLPLPDRVEGRGAATPDDLSSEQVPAHEVLFEMSMIVAAHLAVALSVVLTLRSLGLLGG